ncbi:maleate cis-trans isomerase family protein [Rhodococcus opacus]|uniref:maleate cis-trans isomerase family protein n=1 Tax=Rhodococcus opacus TaxID=37919 RepID=UPI00155A2903|nr:aspartate/glutamate racemase family protein [Rhodococcus opacus]
MYDYRGTIGLLVPSINTVVEHDFHRLAPEGIGVNVSRVATEIEGTVEALEDMAAAARAAAALLEPARPSVGVFACTSSSFINGPAWTKELEADLSQHMGCEVVSTAGAMVRALQSLGAGRVAVVTPYVEVTNKRLTTFLTESGIEVSGLNGLGVLDMYAHAAITPETLYRSVMELDLDSADAVFIACTQMRTIDIIDQLERDAGIPVVTAVQASFWAALNILGDIALPIEDRGRLLSQR